MTEPEAIDGLEGDAGVGRGAAHLDGKLLSGAGGESIAAGGLTRFGAAELEHVSSRRLFPEVVIEGDGAVDLGAGEIEGFGDQRHCRFRHAAEGLLHFVQDGKDGAFHVRLGGDDFACALSVPGFVSMHAQPLYIKSKMKTKPCEINKAGQSPDRVFLSTDRRIL